MWAQSRVVTPLLLLWVLVAACAGEPTSESTVTSESAGTTGVTVESTSTTDGATTTEPASTSAPAAGEPIKIGVILEFTGGGADYGKRGREMIELALEEWNSEVAGRPIEVIYEDNETDPGATIEKAKKLLEQDAVEVVFGPNFSSSKEPLGPYLAEQGVMGNALLGGPYSIGAGRNMISYPGSTESFCVGAGQWASDQGYQTMATLGADYNAGYQLLNPIAEEFTAAGGEVVQQQWAPLGTVDFAPYMAGMADADILSVFTVMPDELALLKQFFEIGPEMELLLCEADNVIPEQLREIGPEIIGAYGIISAYDAAIVNPENEAFVAAVEERYGRTPNIYDGTTYIAMQILLEGLEANEGDATLESLYSKITSMTFDTAGGTVSFTDNGFAISNRFMAQVNEDFEWEVFETFADVIDPRDR